MLLTTLRRDVLMSLLPPNGVAAEIGVYRCNFAKQILEANKPAELHLIDPWEDDGEYVKTYNARDDMTGLYDSARQIFEKEIEAGQVVLQRDFSYNVAPRFADGSLDWAYIDGMHTYEAVKQDLEAFAPKISDDGLLLGHDFSNSPESRRRDFGVVRAVREFVAENDFDLIVFTYEIAATFVLARRDHPASGQALQNKILNHPKAVNLEIDNGVFEGFDHITMETPEGRKRPLFRFRKNIPPEEAVTIGETPKTKRERGWFPWGAGKAK